MSDIGFYHLTRTSAAQALPKLLGRTLAAGQRALVQCADAQAVTAVSSALWASTDPDWLPHGGPDLPGSRPEWQPIWLTSVAETSPATLPANGARFLFLLGGLPHQPGFDRIFDLFDGNDPGQVAQARLRWSATKAAGHRLTYWQQGDKGWTSKA